MARSRRRPLSKEDELTEVYCRKCMEYKTPRHFYSAVDYFLDSNGLFSVCKDCINQSFDSIYETEQDLSRTILRMCRILNVKFDQQAVEATEQNIVSLKEKGTRASSVFGIYKSRLSSVVKGKIGDKGEEDFTFYQPSTDVITEVKSISNEYDIDYFESAWGRGLTMDDYIFLENEFSEWARTTKCDTHAEKVVIREICHIRNNIRKKRNEQDGRGISGELKNLTDMMKSGALTPAQQSAATTGRSAETFSSWIKDIEKKTPAEFHENLEKYHDMDGISEDLEDIKRSIRNFVTNSRDFNSLDIEELEGVISDYHGSPVSKEGNTSAEDKENS